jgi:HTH-type transcriptional regulator / antitoxin HipB
MSENLDEYLVIGPQSLGRSIREFRLRRHLSQQALAEQVGIHRSYLSELESGATTEALERIVRTLSALNLEIVIRERSR